MNLIKNYNEFNMINEEKLYIYSRVFRIADLLDDTIYSPIQISKWMTDYNFDHMAEGVFTSKKIVKNKEILGIRVSSKDMKNKFYFDSESNRRLGTLIEDSEINVDGESLFLYIFEKNSNDQKRARQIHGFRYESVMRKLNNIDKPHYTAKWDANGSIGEELFNVRTDEGKTIEFFDGNSLKPINWNSLDDVYKKDYAWNIKCIKNGNGIDLGSYSRIAGLDKEYKTSKTDIKKFIFNVCFYDGDNKVEYFIYIDMETWKSYLPDHDESEIASMFQDLKKHRLIGKRTIEKEKKWKSYRTKYANITNNSLIKLRFKRESKGQLRIQSGISNINFFNTLLKENKYIKIS